MSENRDTDEDWEESTEEEQIGDAYDQYDIPLKNLTSHTYFRGVWLSMVTFMLLFLLSFFIRIPQEVNLAFELKGGGSESIIQFDEFMRITETYVEMNSHVKSGDALVKVESPEIHLLLSQLKSARDQKSSFDEFTKPKLDKTVVIKEREIGDTEKYLSSLRSQKKEFEENHQSLLDELKKGISLAEKSYRRNESLFESASISEKTLDESQQALVAARSDFTNKKLEFDLRIKDIEILILDYQQKRSQLGNDLELLRLSYDEKSRQAENEVMKILDQINLKYGSPAIEGGALVLKANRGGKITYLNSDEQALQKNEVLLRLETSDAEKKAYAVLKQEDLGSIRAAQPASLKFYNFPYYQFGVVQGKTTNVSTVGTDGEFLVEIELDIGSNKALSGKINEGMRGSATILTDELRLIEYIMHPIIKPFYDV